MRLINVKTLQLECYMSRPPKYAILSHTWGQEEVSLEEWQNGAGRQKHGFAKILQATVRAQGDGYEYLWVDTCCINKDSSAELSEAINSMFAWYRDAAVCYAYLHDIDPGAPWENARWFTRGWTLQELLAPKDVMFFDAAWSSIGSRHELANDISTCTRIQKPALISTESLEFIRSLSIANKMSWAAKRTTTREEDIAYCLLGLFDVNMPLLYGEGGTKAFRRLQQEIIKNGLDLTFLTGSMPPRRIVSDPHSLDTEAAKIRQPIEKVPKSFGGDEQKEIDLLATHPCWFTSGAHITAHGQQPGAFLINNQGLQINLFLLRVDEASGQYLAVLPCTAGDRYLQRNDISLISIPLRLIDATRHTYVRLAGPARSITPSSHKRATPKDCCILSVVPERRQVMKIVSQEGVRLEAYYFSDQSQSWQRRIDPGTIELYHPTEYHPKSYGVVLDKTYILGRYRTLSKECKATVSTKLVRVDFCPDVFPNMYMFSLRDTPGEQCSQDEEVRRLLELPESDIVQEGWKANSSSEVLMTWAKLGRGRSNTGVDTFILTITIDESSSARKKETMKSYAWNGTLVLPIAACAYYLRNVFVQYALFDYSIAWPLVKLAETFFLLHHVSSEEGLPYTSFLFESNFQSIWLYALALISLVIITESAPLTVFVVTTPRSVMGNGYCRLHGVICSTVFVLGFLSSLFDSSIEIFLRIVGMGSSQGHFYQWAFTLTATVGLRIWFAYMGLLVRVSSQDMLLRLSK